MNNKEFVTKLAADSGYSLEDTQRLVRSVLTAMVKQLEKGNAVTVSNFGTFEVKKRLERIMVNPSTGQRMLVPPKLVLNFKPTSSIKELAKSGGEE